MLARIQPYWRWLNLEYAIKKKQPPSDPWLEQLYDLYFGRVEGTEVQQAVISHVFSEFKRDVVMAYLFARCSMTDLEESLELPPEVIDSIARLFFDRTKIRTKLDHIEYAREYIEKFASPEGKSLIYLGMTSGPIPLKNKFCLGYEMPNIDQDYVDHRMYMTAVSFGLMTRGNALTSREGKEAYHWFQQAADMSKTYRKLQQGDDDSQDAIVAIEQRKLIHKPEAAGINRNDVLH
jgi:hypothetical protein